MEYHEAQAKIAGRILVYMAEYMKATGADKTKALKFAFDKVIGVGAYDKLASDIHTTMAAKHA